MAKPDERMQIHIRLQPHIVELIDKRAVELQEEAKKIAPNAKVTRADVVESLVTSALTKRKK